MRSTMNRSYNRNVGPYRSGLVIYCVFCQPLTGSLNKLASWLDNPPGGFIQYSKMLRIQKVHHITQSCFLILLVCILWSQSNPNKMTTGRIRQLELISSVERRHIVGLMAGSLISNLKLQLDRGTVVLLHMKIFRWNLIAKHL